MEELRRNGEESKKSERLLLMDEKTHRYRYHWPSNLDPWATTKYHRLKCHVKYNDYLISRYTRRFSVNCISVSSSDDSSPQKQHVKCSITI